MDGRAAPRPARRSFLEGTTAQRLAWRPNPAPKTDSSTLLDASGTDAPLPEPQTGTATDDARSATLAAIRSSLTKAKESHRSEAHPPPPAIAVAPVAGTGVPEGLDRADDEERARTRVDRFAAALERVQGACHRCTSDEGAMEAIRAIVRDRRVKRLVRSDDPLVRRILEGVTGGFELLPHDSDRAAMLTADLGVTRAARGVAEYGTIVLPTGVSPGTERSRLAALLPDAHVAIIAASDLVERWDDALESMRELPDGPPPTVTFATGPSRTADIELELVLGVHGPRAQHAIVLEHR